MELSDTSFGGTKVPWNIPWNSMELSDNSFGGTRVPWNSMEYSMEFHGTPMSFEMAPSLFHGIPWNSVIFYLATPDFHGIPWNIPWKSRVAWYLLK